MRRIAYLCCAVATMSGYHIVPCVAAAQSPSRRDEKIPITTRSDKARAIYLRARDLNETLKVHEANTLFAQAVALDPTFAMGEYYLASTAPTAKDLTTHLQKAVALSSNASTGERLVILGMQARNHADRALARQLAESLVVLYPRDERAHSALAILYSGQQLYPQAIAEYQKAIDLNPKYSIAYNQLGYANRSAGNMAAAETAFRTYIALIPNDPNPYDSYAELLMKTGRFDESIAQYKKALANDSHFGGSFIGIAADEMLSARCKEAVAESEAYYENARDDSERRTALLNQAMIYVDQGGTDNAIHAMQRSFDIARATGDTANMSADGIIIGDIMLEAGRIDVAHDQYGRAHAFVAQSSLPSAVKQDDALGKHYDAARVALAKHQLPAARSEAAAYLEGATAHRNDVRVRQAHELNARLELHDQKYDEALKELALADQENPAVWYLMARAYDGKGDTAKAKQLANQAVHMNILPTFPDVFTRATVAAATRSATSENAHGTPR